jgi:ribosomal protein L11 methylase PrmA
VEMAIERVDVREQAPPAAPTVVANLTGNLLRDCAAHMEGGDGDPRRLVCSGMLEAEIEEVSGAFAEVGLTESARRTDHGWGGLLLRRAG